MNRSPTAKALASSIINSAPPESHPFVAGLAAGTLPLTTARATALEIGHVVAAFPRFLAAALANIPRWDRRMLLVENLFEEHGGLDASKVHEVTYRQLVAALGVPEAVQRDHRPGLGATVYVRAVMDVCLHQPTAEALGALGVIEEVVARASLAVGTYLRRLDRDGACGDTHFTVHETLDLQHADEIYGLAQHHIDSGERESVERGMRLGHYYHLRLYSDVLAAAVPTARARVA